MDKIFYFFLILIFLSSIAFCLGDALNCDGDLQYCDPCGKCVPMCIKGVFQSNYQQNCTEGCVCEYGYIMDETGRCIPIEKCQRVPKCKINEEYLPCGPACIPRCTRGHIVIPRCRPCCTPGCFCMEGYIRNDNGECIPIDKCILSG